MAGLNRLTKRERLGNSSLIRKIFRREGEIINRFPLSFLFMEHHLPEPVPAQVLFSVPVRKIRKAVLRNRVRRMMKEIYRQKKQEVYALIRTKNERQYVLCMMYNDTVPATYDDLEKKFSAIIYEFGKRVS